LKITTRNASFQRWQALAANRTKRHRAAEFLVQGVRPISLAVSYGWEVHALLFPLDSNPSAWARRVLDEPGAERVGMAPDLLAELGGKDEGVPELVAVVGMPPDRLDRIALGPRPLVIVFDRPTTPGNVGTLVRSADAFGADGVVVTGHAADPYDPKSVRASTGSLFAVPVVRVPAAAQVLDWATGLRIVATDERGAVDVAECDLRGPTLLVVGNETHGLSGAWLEAADETVRIPIGGAASSLNAAAAGTVVLYEAARQRRLSGPR
jgi:23S rRNA (uridine2479-2'-O)-methyltransferase